MELLGMHHVTAITSDAKKCYEFYHKVLGMTLVKKTVNQDDVTAYHLFFADKTGSPGTDLTFFEFKNISRHQHGSDDIYAFTLRVPTDESLYFFKQRFDVYDVKYDAVIQLNGKNALPFYDFDERKIYLISDELNTGIPAGIINEDSPVEGIHQIIGLGPVLLSIKNTLVTASVLNQVLKMERTGEYEHSDSKEPVHVYSMAEGGNGGEVHLLYNNDVPARQGYGGTHHIAFAVKDHEALAEWHEFLTSVRIPNSGLVDRFYFESLYFRDISGVLFELATNGPGFTGDESVDELGTTLSLPPFLEARRAEIESGIDYIDTSRK